MLSPQKPGPGQRERHEPEERFELMNETVLPARLHSGLPKANGQTVVAQVLQAEVSSRYDSR